MVSHSLIPLYFGQQDGKLAFAFGICARPREGFIEFDCADWGNEPNASYKAVITTGTPPAKTCAQVIQRARCAQQVFCSSAGEAWAAQCLPWPCLRHHSSGQNRLAVDDDNIDSRSILVRLLKRRAVAHGRVIEDDDVCGEAFAQQPPVTQVEGLRRKTRHLT